MRGALLALLGALCAGDDSSPEGPAADANAALRAMSLLQRKAAAWLPGTSATTYGSGFGSNPAVGQGSGAYPSAFGSGVSSNPAVFGSGSGTSSSVQFMDPGVNLGAYAGAMGTNGDLQLPPGMLPAAWQANPRVVTGIPGQGQGEQGQQQLLTDTQTLQGYSAAGDAQSAQRTQQLQQLQQLQQQLLQQLRGQAPGGLSPQAQSALNSVQGGSNSLNPSQPDSTSARLNDLVNSQLMSQPMNPDQPTVTNLITSPDQSGLLNPLSSSTDTNSLFDSIAKQEASLKAMATLIDSQTQKIKENEATAAKMSQLNVINKAILKKNKAALKVAGERLLATVTSFTQELGQDGDIAPTSAAAAPTVAQSSMLPANNTPPTAAPAPTMSTGGSPTAAGSPTASVTAPTTKPAGTGFVEESATTSEPRSMPHRSAHVSKEKKALLARLRSLIKTATADTDSE